MKRRIGEERKEEQGAGGEKKVKKEDDGGIEGEEDIADAGADQQGVNRGDIVSQKKLSADQKIIIETFLDKEKVISKQAKTKEGELFSPSSIDSLVLPVNNIATMMDLQGAIGAVGLPPGGFGALTASTAANTAALAGLPAILVNINATLAILAPLPAAIANLQTTVNNLKDDIALANNRGASSIRHPIMPRSVPGGVALPIPLPPCIRDFQNLNAHDAGALLAAYGLPPAGPGENLPSRRRRLLQFLGLPDQLI